MSQNHDRSFSVDSDAYPFRDHWFERGDTAMHYVDEGEGVPVLMLHGNPTWSYLYRNVIKQLRNRCRCLAVDYPGFGFSEHPEGYGYTPEEHAGWISDFVRERDLENVILVMHDWGGPIGLSVAVEQLQRIGGMVICNTWCWEPDWWMGAFSTIVGGTLGRYMHSRHNAFVRFILPTGIANKEGLSGELKRAYRGPFPTPESRKGTWVFPRAIRTSSSWVRDIRDHLVVLLEKPVELVWGMKDPAFGWESYLGRWQTHFPEASVTRLSDASHYLQEDRPDAVAEGIQQVLQRLD